MKKQNINLLKQEYVKPEIKSLQAELEQLLADSFTLDLVDEDEEEWPTDPDTGRPYNPW